MAVIGVVGLGVMGLGIAQVFAAAGHDVLVTDANADSRGSAVARMRRSLEPRVAAGKMRADEMEALLGRLAVTDVAGVANADLVIEAIIEDLAAKQALFQQIEAVSDAILASNTSSLAITRHRRLAWRSPKRLSGCISSIPPRP